MSKNVTTSIIFCNSFCEDWKNMNIFATEKKRCSTK